MGRRSQFAVEARFEPEARSGYTGKLRGLATGPRNPVGMRSPPWRLPYDSVSYLLGDTEMFLVVSCEIDGDIKGVFYQVGEEALAWVCTLRHGSQLVLLSGGKLTGPGVCGYCSSILRGRTEHPSPVAGLGVLNRSFLFSARFLALPPRVIQRVSRGRAGSIA